MSTYLESAGLLETDRLNDLRRCLDQTSAGEVRNEQLDIQVRGDDG